MKKFYFLVLALGLFNGVAAQNPSDRDPGFNPFNVPPNQYFVGEYVTKSEVLPDGKILLITNESKLVRLQGNQTDTSFNTGTGFAFAGSSVVLTDFAVQPDGKIIIGGIYTTYNGVSRSGLIRLNQDGSIDTSFNLAGVSIQNQGIKQVEVQADGKIMVVAEETNLGGSTNNIKRLNPDGSLDTSFATVPNFIFGRIAIQADGKYIVSHNTNGVYYSDINKIARLNTDGSFDTSFTTATLLNSSSAQIIKLAVLSNGKIIVGGSFSACNSLGYQDLVKLNTDGSVDTSFTIGAGFESYSGSYRNDTVSDIVEQPDNKLIVVGKFAKFNTINRVNVVRLNENGSLNPTFSDVANFLNIGSVKSVSLFSDQKILVSGDLGDYKKPDNYITKLNSDGTKDTSYNNITKGFFNYPVQKVVQTADGKILVAGNFHSYNGSKCFGFTRLNYDGSIDNTLTYGGSNGFENGIGLGNITAIGCTAEGKIYLGGAFTTFNGQTIKSLVRINPDGTRDSSFSTGNNGFDYGYTSVQSIKDILPLPNGEVFIAGTFHNYNGTNTSGVIRLGNSGTLFSYFDIGNDVTSLKLQSDGKLLVGLGSVSLGSIKRYNTNHTLDTSFVLDPSLIEGRVNSFEIQQDDKILLCGEFSSNRSLVRILSNGSLDPTFNFSLQSTTVIVKSIALTPNQKIVVSYVNNPYVSQTTVMRLNNDGSVDSLFNAIPPIQGQNGLISVYAQNDGKILLYGYLKNAQGNPGSGLNRLMGEDYNFIQGQNKIDSNANGCDINDAAFTNLKLHVSSGANTFEYITNTTGNYKAALSNGTHNIAPAFENPTYFNASPSMVNVAFPAQASPFTQNFCITANGTHPDLEIVLLPINAVRPGSDAKYKIVYKNKGTSVQSGSVNLLFNDAVLDFVSANPVTSAQTTNNLSWDFINLAPFETREIAVTLNVNSPMETPAVNGGDVLNYTTTITSVATDEMPNDNTFVFHQTVVNSFDPNDKTCLEGATISPSKVGEYVHYMIRFENTGTFAAQNIVVKDMIDTAKFDVNSLVPMKGSHSFVTNITSGNKVEFIFENINLPFDDTNNDGYVAFKIKTKPTLVSGNTFSNTASIYFDYNFPIVTNTATTTIAALSVQDFEFSNYFSLYPNPVHDVLHISAKESIEVSSINVYNTLGQLVLVIPNAKEIKTVDVSNLTSGNYFIKINSDKGTSNAKFIKY